ncbi:MAG: hypothetical protein Q8P89_03225 [bacterium]|nr:hypothetical protein [bacterium]
MTPLRDNSVLQLSLYGGSAELLVIDPKGKRTGLDPRTGTSFEEIPASSYGEESLGADDGSGQIMSRKLLWISRPLSGEYTVEVIGTGYARISLEVRPVDINSDGQRISVDGNMLALGVDTIEAMVTPGVSNVYRLTYSSTPDQPAKLIRLK